MTSLKAGLVTGLIASVLSGGALADDQGPIRSHFSQDRSHFSQHHSTFHQNDAFGEQGWQQAGRPGFDGRPGVDGQWGYDGRPGFGWHRPQRIDPDEQLRRQYDRLYDGQRRQFDRERQATIYGAAPHRFHRPDQWQPSPYPAPGGYRPPSTGYPLPPHGYPLPGQSRPPAFSHPDRGVDLYSDPRGPAPATPYSR